MMDSIKIRCDLLAENYRILSNKTWWNYSSNNRLGALLYAMEDRTVDVDAINKCKKIIRDNSGLFSRFKDITYFMTAVILSLKSDPEKVFQATVTIYKDMKKEGFYSSIYLTLAALSIAVQAEPHEYQRIISTTGKFYEAMKTEHRFLTHASDYGYAALLAMSDKSVSSATKDMESCYQTLMNEFFSHNSVQSLSHVLAFGEEDASKKCEKVIKLYQELRNRQCKFGTRYELPVLGVAALLSEDIREMADEIAEVNQYLKQKKGFGVWLAQKERLMYVTAMVSGEYAAGLKDKTVELSLANSITGILLAQEMAMIAATSAAAAASSSSSS